MGVMVIVGYRPKPGREADLENEVRGHLPLLRSEGLATNRPGLAMRAADGTIVEVFEWVSQAAIEAAHGNPAVAAMWERFEACCDYVPVGSLEESTQLFSAFAPVEIATNPAGST
jgi:hypothetical protein